MCLTLVAGLPIILVMTCNLVQKIRLHRESPRSPLDTNKYISVLSQKMRECFVGDYWRPIVLFRWSLTNLIIIFLRDHPEMQVSLLLAVSVFFQSALVYYRLIPDRLDFAINLFNELAASVYLYLMMLLTDFQGENPLRDNIGWALLGLVSLVVTINVIKTFV